MGSRPPFREITTSDEEFASIASAHPPTSIATAPPFLQSDYGGGAAAAAHAPTHAYPAVYQQQQQQQPQQQAAALQHEHSSTASGVHPFYSDLGGAGTAAAASPPHAQVMGGARSPKPPSAYDGRLSLMVDAGPSSRHLHQGAGGQQHLPLGTGSYRPPDSPPASALAMGRGAGRGGGGGAGGPKPHPADSSLERWLVPDSEGHHWALWVSTFTLSACFLFAFMAGNYPTYQQSITFLQYHNGTAPATPLVTTWGPVGLLGWLRFWSNSAVHSFDAGYLMAWGARYQPAIVAGEWWRLFSSICIHGSFSHLFSNMFALVILAVPLEHTYGPLRVFVIFMAAGFGGTFLSMAFEDPCFVYVGASGAVFGFLGLSLADVLLNFESMYRPLLRLVLMLLALGLTLGIEFATARVSPLLKVSHLSHIGGLIAGLFVSFLFLPNLRDRRWQSARKFAHRVSHTLYERLSHPGGGGGAGAGFGPSASAAHAAAAARHQRWLTLERMQSCWRRHAWLYWCVWALSALVVLFAFVGLPVYVWRSVMPQLACAPLVGGGGAR